MYPCTRAMVTDVTTISPDTTVEDVLKIYKEKNIRNVPVVDKDGKFLGLMGLHQILIALLPKAATMKHGLPDLSFVVGAAPGIAKKLKKLHDVQILELMKTDGKNIAHCETSTIEALRIMSMYGSPVVVTEKATNKFRGIISRKTLLDDLYGLLEEIEKEESEDETAA